MGQISTHVRPSADTYETYADTYGTYETAIRTHEGRRREEE